MALKAQNNLVAIHDGVRPFIAPEMIEACIQGAQQTGACILGVPATDTLKQVNTEKFITSTMPRRNIWLAQTPQVFDYKLIREAHDAARLGGVWGTDDAALVEKSGHPVKIVMGSRMNIKITTPDDLKMAEAVLKTNTHIVS
jgi:2-C-methyl-D-erythritol 4-phosphate cytidylyltransferase